MADGAGIPCASIDQPCPICAVPHTVPGQTQTFSASRARANDAADRKQGLRYVSVRTRTVGARTLELLMVAGRVGTHLHQLAIAQRTGGSRKPAGRTPSMQATNSCVMWNSSACARSRVIKSRRASRASTRCKPVHAAVCAIGLRTVTVKTPLQRRAPFELTGKCRRSIRARRAHRQAEAQPARRTPTDVDDPGWQGGEQTICRCGRRHR